MPARAGVVLIARSRPPGRGALSPTIPIAHVPITPVGVHRAGAGALPARLRRGPHPWGTARVSPHRFRLAPAARGPAGAGRRSLRGGDRNSASPAPTMITSRRFISGSSRDGLDKRALARGGIGERDAPEWRRDGNENCERSAGKPGTKCTIALPPMSGGPVMGMSGLYVDSAGRATGRLGVPNPWVGTPRVLGNVPLPGGSRGRGLRVLSVRVHAGFPIVHGWRKPLRLQRI
jgi:hypothetical protein